MKVLIQFRTALLIIVCLIISSAASAQNLEYVEYGLVKFISPNGEFKEDVHYKFAFGNGVIYKSGSNVISFDLGDGTHTSYMEYGKYVGMDNGNYMYQKYVKGVGIMGAYNRVAEDGNVYFVVSPDRSVINEITYNSVGKPIYVYVYQRARKPSGNLYQ